MIDRARLIPVDAIRADSIVKREVVTWAKEVQGIKVDYVVTDAAPNDRSLGTASAISDLVLVPCASQRIRRTPARRSPD
jgi:hypothetical protein